MSANEKRSGVRLTAEQRAEKIATICILAWPKKPDLTLIAAQIEEAEREAIIKLCEGDDCYVAQQEQKAYAEGFRAAQEKKLEWAAKESDSAYERGFRAAKEKAKGIAMEHKDDGFDFVHKYRFRKNIAQHIGEMEP